MDWSVSPATASFLWVLFLVSAPHVRSGLPFEANESQPETRFSIDIPAVFTENAGQVKSEDVRYYLRSEQFTLGLAPGALMFDMRIPAARPRSAQGELSDLKGASGGVLVRLEFAGSAPVIPEGRKEETAQSHFFLGGPSDWRTGVRSFGEIAYLGLYPGIDLTYLVRDGELKYEFSVQPGADPAEIRMAYERHDSLFIDSGGDLVVHTRAGDLRDSKPLGFQGDQAVPCAFALRDLSTVGFECNSWDRTRPLKIDPLVRSTLLGGSLRDYAWPVAVDASGNVYVAGVTWSADFPTTPGAYDQSIGGDSDVFVAKFSSSGALVYSSFLGGSDNETATGISLVSDGSAFLTGGTSSNDFPTTAGAFQTISDSFYGDAFVTKLNPSGNALVYSTLLGGYWYPSYSRSMAVDAVGNVFVVGGTDCPDFPTTPGAFDETYDGGGDVFVAKINPAGSALVYSTFLGGDQYDSGLGIAIDDSGHAFVTGRTYSMGFPVTAGAFDVTIDGSDAFVSELSPSGSALEYSTFLGGSNEDWAESIALDDVGNAYLTGVTRSSDFPTTPSAHDRSLGVDDAFVTKLNAAGSVVIFSTFLGGGWVDSGKGIAVDSAGFAYVTGTTNSADFPVAVGAFDTSRNGFADAFVAKVDASGKVPYASYLGGQDYDSGLALALHPGGGLVVAGWTSSTDFPTTPAAYDGTPNGDWDAFVSWILLPETHPVTLITEPIGLMVTLGGLSRVAPHTFWCLQNSFQTLIAPSPQGTGSPRNVFESWSDGGPSSHQIQCDAPATYTARFGLGYRITLRTWADLPPYNLWLIVDGEWVMPREYWWLNESTHTIDVPSPQGDTYVRKSFVRWSDGGAKAHSIVVTGDADYLARFETIYSVIIRTVPPLLRVIVDGVELTMPRGFWWPAGVHELDVPSPQVFGTTRYVFTTWSDGGARNHYVAIHEPANLTASFQTEFLMTVASTPGGLQVIIDGVSGSVPQQLWWAQGSLHTLSVVSPQDLAGTRYAFVSWSDGGAQAHYVSADGPGSYAAVFAATHFQAILSTNPGGLDLSVDGLSVNAPAVYWWVRGSHHTIDAPSPQYRGSMRYEFGSWSDGGPQRHVVVASRPLALFAAFDDYYLVRIETSPPGLQVSWDGSLYNSVHSEWCLKGSSHVVDTPSPQGGPDTRYEFQSWSDGGAKFHPIACQSPTTLTATFTVQHEIVLETEPAGLDVTLDGAAHVAPSRFWCAAASVHSLEVPSPQGAGPTRWAFESWSDGGARSHAIRCDAPATYTATFALAYEIVVNTSPQGREIGVDGVQFTAPQSFWWTSGSTHELDVPSPQVSGDTRYPFVSWSDGGSRRHDVNVTGSATVTATFGIEYWITLATSPVALMVSYDGFLYMAPFGFWCPANTRHIIGTPSPQGLGPSRYAFRDWSEGYSLPWANQDFDFDCLWPSVLTAAFNREFQVTITTLPPSLNVIVDGVIIATPQTYWWVEGSLHYVDALTPQGVGGTRYSFLAWSNGAARAHELTVSGQDTIVATFLEEHELVFSTYPEGLRVGLDGTVATTPFAAWCAVGSSHLIDAPNGQGTSQSRYSFTYWSDGGARSHTIRCDAPGSFTAFFSTEHSVVVDTDPPGLSVFVDDVQYTAPHAQWCPAGSTLRLSAPTPQGTGSTRYVFSHWSDRRPMVHGISCNVPAVYTASFKAEHAITILSNPGGLQVALDGVPSGAPHLVWCLAGSAHSIEAVSPQILGGTRYAFESWSDGGNRLRTIPCDAPATYTANFVAIPSGDFEVTATPENATVIDGGSVQFLVTVSSIGGYGGPDIAISIRGAPDGSTWACDPWSLPPPGVCTLMLMIPASAPAGAYAIAIEGTNGTVARAFYVTVHVERSSSPAFSITADPTSLRIRAGTSDETHLQIEAIGGLVGDVTLSVAWSPPGMDVRFSPSRVTGSGSVTVTFTAGQGVRPGTYAIVLRGTSGELERAVIVTITVIQNPAGPDGPALDVILWGLVLFISVILTATHLGILLWRRRRRRRTIALGEGARPVQDGDEGDPPGERRPEGSRSEGRPVVIEEEAREGPSEPES